MTPTPRTAIERLRYRIGETGIAGESALLEEALVEAQAAAPDALREALDTANKELLSDEMSDLSGDHLYSRRMAFIRSVRAALVAPTAPAGPPCAFCDSPNGKKWHRLSCIEVRSAAPATLPAIDTRIVWKRDHGMVIVTGDEEPQSLEIPAWAVRTIFDVAGKDPEEEARKVSAFINAHTGLDVERLLRRLSDRLYMRPAHLREKYGIADDDDALDAWREQTRVEVGRYLADPAAYAEQGAG